MEIRKLNPTTPGCRHQIILTKSLLNKTNFLGKTLTKYHQRKYGRGSDLGHITVWHKGGGVKKLYRLINFGNFFSKLLVLGNFYDPYRSAFISLTFNFIKKKFDFLTMTEYVYPGSILLFNFEYSFLDLKLGYRTLIKNIPAGSFIHGLSINLFSKTQYIRSAGTSGQIIQKANDFFKIRLASGNIIVVSDLSVATIGINSNTKHNLICIGKAGKNRLKGKRSKVRGVAMNPVDHPHGGRTNGGKPCVTPWGIPTRGKPTVKKKN